MVDRFTRNGYIVSSCFDCLVVKVLSAFSMRVYWRMGGMERIGHFRGRITAKSVRRVTDFMV